MPVSVRRTPFSSTPTTTEPAASTLLTPEARALLALMPSDLSDPVFDWPILTRAGLSAAMGYTPTSGTVTRALNGGKNMPTGPRLPGLIAMGCVDAITLDVEGVSETNYRITAAGIRAYRQHIARRGELPPVRSVEDSTNDRYKNNSNRGVDVSTPIS